MVSRASNTMTFHPACARAIAADSPFGPAPTTMASGGAAIGLLGSARASVARPGAAMVHDVSGYWYSRWLFERGLAIIYLIGFVVAVNQFVPLAGEHGLLPAAR